MATSNKSGADECVGNAQVTLRKGETVVAETKTDAFGDFRFDRLDPDSGGYNLSVSKDGLGTATVDINLGDSLTLDAIRI